MDLFEVGFVKVGLVDIIDIAVVAFLIYQLYKNIKGRLALRVISLILLLFLVWKIVDLLGFTLLSSIMGEFLGLGAISVVIIFAPEIRNFLAAVSQNSILERFIRPTISESQAEQTIREVVEALKTLRATGNGALIVITGSNPLSEIQETGDLIDGTILARVIFTIFQKESPLHDGAMILANNRIASVRCILPISKSDRLDPELGLRHRSAVGVTEISDALVLVVSEERREVSLALHGNLKRNIDYHEVEEMLQAHLNIDVVSS